MIFSKIKQPPRPDLYILKGTAQYQMDQFEKTIESVEEAISLAESRNADRVTQLQKNVTSAAGKYRVKYDRNNIDYISLANEVKKVLKLQLEQTRKGNEKYVQLEEEIKGLEADAKNLSHWANKRAMVVITSSQLLFIRTNGSSKKNLRKACSRVV